MDDLFDQFLSGDNMASSFGGNIPKQSRNYRNESEMKRESKGDPILGKIFLPEEVRHPQSHHVLTISVVSRDLNQPKNPLNLHPNILFLQVQNVEMRKKDMTSADFEILLHIFTVDKLKVIALNRGTETFQLPNGETITGKDVSPCIQDDILYLGQDPPDSRNPGLQSPSYNPRTPDSAIGEEITLAKERTQVKKGLRITIIKAAQKGPKQSKQSVELNIRHRLDNIRAPEDWGKFLHYDGLMDKLVKKEKYFGGNCPIPPDVDWTKDIQVIGDQELKDALIQELKGEVAQSICGLFKFTGEDASAMHMARIKIELFNKITETYHQPYISEEILNTNCAKVKDLYVRQLHQDRICVNFLRTNKIFVEFYDKIAQVQGYLESDELGKYFPLETQIENKIAILRLDPERVDEIVPGNYYIQFRRERTGAISNGVLLTIQPETTEGERCFCNVSSGYVCPDPREKPKNTSNVHTAKKLRNSENSAPKPKRTRKGSKRKIIESNNTEENDIEKVYEDLINDELGFKFDITSPNFQQQQSLLHQPMNDYGFPTDFINLSSQTPSAPPSTSTIHSGQFPDLLSSARSVLPGNVQHDGMHAARAGPYEPDCVSDDDDNDSDEGNLVIMTTSEESSEEASPSIELVRSMPEQLSFDSDDDEAQDSNDLGSELQTDGGGQKSKKMATTEEMDQSPKLEVPKPILQKLSKNVWMRLVIPSLAVGLAAFWYSNFL